MSKRIVISCYRQDRSNPVPGDIPEFVYSRSLITDLLLDDIERIMVTDTDDGFMMSKIEGKSMSFLDFCYFLGQEGAITQQVDKIPESCNIPEDDITDFSYAKITRIYDDDISVLNKSIFVRCTYRFELGTSDFSSVVTYIEQNPWLMILAGIIIDKIFDFFISLLKKKRKISSIKSERIYFKYKSFLNSFAEMINHNKNHLEIVDLHSLSNGDKEVKVRTYTNRQYKVTCTSRGQILEYDLMPHFNEFEHYITN